jgi:outer membrane protein TolC
MEWVAGKAQSTLNAIRGKFFGRAARVYRLAVHKGAGSVALGLVLSLWVVSCTPSLVQLRQDNAQAVLSMYRARPLTALTHGKDVLALDDCVQIALANSLDMQTALWEEQVRQSLARSAGVRMLPRAETTFEESARDRTAWSRSDVMGAEGAWERNATGPEPGTGVTNFSTSRELGQRLWNVQLKWSPMDACMARYLTQVKSNEAIHARYQRARVAQQLVGTVTATFYRLLALTQAVPKAQALEANRRSIASDLASLDESAMVDKQELITARSLLTEASNTLAEMYVTVEKQKELLASAMNVSPCSSYRLLGSLLPLPTPCLDSCQLESEALVSRPEAYQADLTFLSSVADQKRLITKLFPRMEGYYGYFRDENKFQYSKNWTDGGFRVTWELMDFASTLLEQGAAKEKVFKNDQERALVSMGILTQVKLKTLEAIRALERFKKTSELERQAGESVRIAKDLEQAKQRGSTQQTMRIARQRVVCVLLQAEIDRLMALGEVHAAFAELSAAVGTNYPVTVAHPPTEQPDPVTAVAIRSLNGLRQAAMGAKHAVDLVTGPVWGILPSSPRP